MKRYSGFAAHFRFRQVPADECALVTEIPCVFSSFEPPDLYQTKAEALKAVRTHLLEQREIDLLDLENLSKPYPACPEVLLEELRADARKSLAIAEGGLALCDQLTRC